jgi:hypothetical protein
MRIYKSKFMPKDSIYQILGDAEYKIRHSYTGGAVDMYKPHNQIGGDISSFLNKIKDDLSNFFVRLYYYDVNSLYPSVMKYYKMPIGKPTQFEGDIFKIDPNAFGFFYCKITSPEYLEHPILQRRIKTKDGIRTIAGLGTWEDWIFSTQ